MANLKKRLVYVAGIVVAIVTVRKWRQRRAKSQNEESDEVTHETPETAGEHASAAAQHAKTAAEKAVATREDR